MNPERITCEDVRIGDVIARARTHDFQRVTAITEGPISRSLWFGLVRIRPRRTAKLWRLTNGE